MGGHKQRFRFSDFYRFPGFNFAESFYEEDHIVVSLHRTRSTGTCPACGKRCSHINARRTRRVRDLNVVTTPVSLEFTMFEVDCHCGYLGWELLPFCDEYSRYTTRFEEKVVILCAKMTIKDVATEMSISWNAVKLIDKKHLRKYLVPLGEANPEEIGVDEIAYEKGQKYLTVVRDAVIGKVIWVGEGRKKETLDTFFSELGAEKALRIKYAVLDMWDPYIASIKANTDAIIVFDKFHVAKKINEAVDAVRKQEFAKADPHERKEMKHKRFIILSRRKNLDEKKRETLQDLLSINATLQVAYLLKEQVLDIFDERTPQAALSRLEKWFRNVKDAGITAFDSVVKTMRNYFNGIINYFHHPITNAQSEGINNKINVIKRKAYGFKDLEYFKLKILQTCGIRSSK
jgi:transposase